VIPKSPAVGIKLPAKLAKPIVFLSHHQVDALSEAAQLEAGDREAAHVLLLAYTGLRWGEAVALKVRQRNRARRRLRIEDNIVQIAGERFLGTPKSGQARTISYPAFLDPILDELARGKGSEHYLLGDGFLAVERPHAENGWFARAVRRCQAADETFSRITPHDLRHTAASLAISAGANVKAVQRMLGHASAAVTLDIYAALFDDDLDKVASALDAARRAG